jgi:aryl-alcohol dehydrogenase-like predicted oxidoreductase
MKWNSANMERLVLRPADRAESVATIQEALAAGVTLFDTGDFYGMGHNEMLIAEALKGGRRDKAILCVKFGARRGPAGGWSGADARPADRHLYRYVVKTSKNGSIKAV